MDSVRPFLAAALVLCATAALLTIREFTPPDAAAAPRPYRVPERAPRAPHDLLLFGRLLDGNTATAEDLEVLPGIGPSLAARIVADRAARGPFRSVADLARVRGIGPRLLDRLRPWLVIDNPALPK